MSESIVSRQFVPNRAIGAISEICARVEILPS